MKAVGSTHESGACSVGLSHTGCACAHEVEPRADERIALDTALRDLESHRSLHGGDSSVLPDAERRRSLSLTLLKRHLALREKEVRYCMDDGRRDICEAPLRARECRVELQQTPTCADRRVDGGGRKQAGTQGRHERSQLHRGSCCAAGGRSLVKSG